MPNKLRNKDIKPERAKYTRRVGNNKRGKNSTEWLDDLSKEEMELISAIKVNDIDFKESLKSQVGKKVLDDLKGIAKKKQPSLEEVIDSDLIDDSISLIRNLAHWRRPKTSGTVLGATAIGAAVGAGIGFWLIPGIGPFIGGSVGAALGGTLGGVTGAAAMLGVTYLAKTQAQKLSKKWYPDEYHYDLDKKTTREFKKRFGVPEHVLQLVNGYLHNRLQHSDSDYMQERIALLRKLCVEEQAPSMMPDLLGFLSTELADIEKTYHERLKEYNDYKENSQDKESEIYQEEISKKAEELYALQDDYVLVRYMMRKFNNAHVDGKKKFQFPEVLNQQLKRTLPSIRPDNQRRRAEMAAQRRLSETKSQLAHEMGGASPAFRNEPETSSKREQSLFHAPAENMTAETLGRVFSDEEIGEFSKDFQRQLTKQEFLGLDNVTVSKQSGGHRFSFQSKEGQSDVPPILFQQKTNNNNQATASLSMDMGKSMEEKEIERAMNVMLLQIQTLVQQDPARKNQVLEIKPDKSLSPEKRLAAAKYLIAGLEEQGIKYRMVNFTKQEENKIKHSSSKKEKAARSRKSFGG